MFEKLVAFFKLLFFLLNLNFTTVEFTLGFGINTFEDTSKHLL